MPAESRDARVTLADVFDSIPGLDEKYRELIEGLFASEKIREVSTAITCKCCGKERKYLVAVAMPNYMDRAKALDVLLTQAKGKPAETKTIDLNLTAVKTRDELAEMSDEQLALIAAVKPERKELTDGKQGKPSAARKPAAPDQASRRRSPRGPKRPAADG